MGRQKREFLDAQRDVKQHYKMYKAGKNWLFAGISIATFGSLLFFGANAADAATTTVDSDSTTTTTQPATSAASELNAQSVALKTSTAAAKSTTSATSTVASATANSTAKSTKTASTAISATATSTAAASTTASVASTTTSAATTAVTTASATSVAATSTTSVTSTAAATTSSTASTAATTSTAASTTTSATATSQQTSAASTTAATTTSILNQLPKGTTLSTLTDGTTQFELPVGADTAAAQKIVDAANLSTAVTLTAKDAAADTTDADDEVDTGDLNGKNPAGDNAAIDTIDTPDKVTDSFETTGSATDGADGSVTLTNSHDQNGSYVFSNQVDTSKGFTLTGHYSSSSFKGTGGGLGIIIQPVDPQDAGENKNTTADVGIDGLANTTFIGRDFYVDSSRGDTAWSAITIRQTDASGNIITTPLANITGTVNNVGGQTGAVTNGEYYTLVWTPISVDGTTGKVTGTLSYTTYTDSTKKTVMQTTGNITVVLSKAVSLAAFGATGGTSAVQKATITSFTGTRVTMPVTIHYVNQSGATVFPDDTITVNVGSTFGVSASTDTTNNTATSGTYAAKTITKDGVTYIFGAATAAVTVINTNISTGTNEITVTYLAQTGTQTVSYDNPPANTTGADFTDKTQTATEASIKPETSSAAHGYAEVAINQIPGYISMVSKGNGPAVAATSIAAEDPGATDEAYTVTYVAKEGSITVHYQDYFNHTIHSDGTTTGKYDDTALNLITDAPTIAGYKLDGKDDINQPATGISFVLDANGNVVATDATGKQITDITLYYKTNIELTITGTKVYDGLDQDYGSDEFPDDPNNVSYLIFTNTKTGEPITLDTSKLINTNIAYSSPNVGNYPDTILANIGMLNTKNSKYNVTSLSLGDFTITAAPIDATITTDDTASKVYDGKTISYIPKVSYTGISGVMIAPDITWEPTDFEYLNAAGTVVGNPKDVGNYTIQFSAAGLAKLAAQTNYTITSKSVGTYEITASNLTVKISSSDKIYDGQIIKYLPTVTMTSTNGGTVPTITWTADDFEFTKGGTLATDTKNADSYGIQLSTAGLAKLAALSDYSDYSFAQTNGTYTINKKAATITVDDGSFAYDGQAHSLTAADVTIAGAVDGEQLDYTLTNNSQTEVGSQTVGIAVTDSTINQNYTITATDTGELAVTVAAVKVVISSDDKTYDGLNISYVPKVTVTPVEDGGSVPNISGITWDATDFEFTKDGTVAADTKNVDSYGIQFSAAGLTKLAGLSGYSNYSFAQTNGTYTINKKAATITVDDGSFVYNGNAHNLDNAVTIDGAVEGDALGYTLTNNTRTNVGSQTVGIELDGKAINNNYTITATDTGTLTITPKAVTITVKDHDYDYDGNAHSLTAADVVVGDIATGEQLSYTFTNNNSQTEAGSQMVGIVLTADNMVNKNYKITATDTGKLTVSPATVTISIGSGSKTYDGKTISLPAVTVTGKNNVVAPNITWAITDFEFNDGTQVLANTKNAGTYRIQLSAAGSAKLDKLTDYSFTSTNGTYIINKKAASITVTDGTFAYDGKAHSLTGVTKDTVSGDQLVYDLSNNSQTNVGSQKVSIVLDTANEINKNYAITADATAKLTVTPAAVGVAINDGVKIYDGQNISLPTVTLSGDKDDVMPNITWDDADFEYVLNSTIVSSTKDAGTYTIRLTQAGLDKLNDLTNYKFDTTNSDGSYTINKKAATITVTGGKYPYDGTLHQAASRVDGAVNNEKLSYTVTAGLTNVGSEPVTATFDANNTINKNYDIKVAAVGATLTVTAIAGTVVLAGGEKTYDGKKVAGLTITAPVAVDLVQDVDYTITPVTGTTNLTGAGTYTYQLTQAGIDKIKQANSNYALNDLTDLTATYTIKQKQITLTADNTGKIFGAADPELTASTEAGAVIAGDTIAYTATREAGETVGKYTITVTAGTNANYTVKVTDGIFTITPAAFVNYIIDSGSKVYNGQVIGSDKTESLPTIYGVLAGGSKVKLTWTSSNLKADFVFTPVAGGTGDAKLTNVGAYTGRLTMVGINELEAENPSYYLAGIGAATVIYNYTITPAPATIVINGSSKVYDGSSIVAPTISLTDANGVSVPKTVQLSVGDYTIVSTSGSTDLKDVGSYQIKLTAQGITKVEKEFSNFSLGTSTATTADYTITKRPATVTVIGGSYVYDESNSDKTYTPTDEISGTVGEDKLDVTLTGKISYPGVVKVSATVAQGDSVNKNYDITVIDGSLSMTGKAFYTTTRTITFTGAGDKTPNEVIQTLGYKVTEDDAGVHYTFINNAPDGNIPVIAGYTASIDGVPVEGNADGYVAIGDKSVQQNSINAEPTSTPITVDYAANTEQVTVSATGNDVENGTKTFTYTVNGGDVQTGTYGTTLADIHYGDTVVITPGEQVGYDSSIDHSTIVVGNDATANVAKVTYVASYRQVNVEVIEKTTGKVIGNITLNGKTGETYTIADPPASLNLDYMEGMNNGNLEHGMNNVPLLTLVSVDGSLSGEYAPDQADNGTVKIYYTMNSQTLNIDYVKQNADGSYQNVGLGTVTYDPATGVDGMSWTGIPAGYATTPVDSVIHYIDSGAYVSLGSNSAGIYTLNDLNLNVAENTATISMLIDKVFNPSFVLTPLAQTVTVTAVGNTSDDFTYTVNGGAELTGKYGEALTNIVTGDVIVVTPNVQAGDAYKQSKAQFAVGTEADKNTDEVVYSPIALNPAKTTYGDTPSYTLNIETDSGVAAVDLTATDVDVATDKTDPHLAAGSYDVTLNAAGLVKLQAANPDFTFGTITGTLVVNKKQITVTANNDSKVYGTADPVLTATVSDGVLTGDTLNYTISRATGEDAGSYFETIQVGDNANYAIIPVAGRFTITPATPTSTITIGDAEGDNLSKTYDGTTFSTSPVVQGPEKDVTLADGDYEYVDANGNVVTDPVNAGNYKIKLTADGIKAVTAANSNYDLGDLSRLENTATIAKVKASLTVTSNDDITFDGKAHSLDIVATGAVNGETIKYTTDNNLQTSVGQYDVTVTATATDVNKNYDITIINGSMTIVKAATTPGEVTIGDAASKDLSKTYDGKTFSVSPVVQGPEKDVTLGSGDYEYLDADGKVVTNPVNAGAYQIKLTAAGIKAVTDANSDYDLGDLSTIKSDATINKAKASLTVTSNDQINYDGKAHSLGIVTEGAVNGETIAYTTGNNSQISAGQYDVTVSADANDINSNYDITVVNGSMTIVKATVPASEITIGDAEGDDLSKTYDGKTFSVSPVVHGPEKNVTLTANEYKYVDADGKVVTDPVNAGNYKIQLTEAGIKTVTDANSDYDLGDLSKLENTAIINKAKATVTVTSDNDITYDGKAHSLDVAITGAVKGEAITYTISNNSHTNVGQYDVTVTADTNSVNSNYNITVNNGSMTIIKAKATLTVTSDNNITYDGKAHSLDVVTKGAVNGETITYTTGNNGQINAGQYDVTATADVNSVNSNYDITINNGSMTIVKAKATLTVTSDNNITYDGQAHSLDVVTKGAVNGETITYTTGNNGQINAGQYDVTVTADTNTVNDNYDITVVGGSMTITKATTPAGAITIGDAEGDNLSKTYDGKTFSTSPVVQGPEKNVTLADGDYEYIDAKGNVVTDPVSAGDYQVKLTQSGIDKVTSANSDYDLGDLSGIISKVTINKAKATVTVTSDDDITYDGKAHSLDVVTKGAVNGETITYTTSDNSYTNVGKYAVTATADNDSVNSNYDITVTNGSMTIVKATVPATEITIGDVNGDNLSKIYDGKTFSTSPVVQGPEADVTLADGDYEYIDVKGNVVTDPVNAGDYQVKLTQSGIDKVTNANSDYDLGDLSGIASEVTINKAKATVTVTSDDDITYDGKAHTLAVNASGAVNGETITYTTSNNSYTNAGKYAVTATADDNSVNSNYDITVTNGSMTIVKATVPASEITIGDVNGDNLSKTYDGKTFSTSPVVQGPEVDVTLADGDYEYVDVKGNVVTDPVNAGDYQVKLTQSGIDKVTSANSDYDLGDLSGITSEVTINKAKATVTVTSDDDITYDGKAHSLAVNASGAVNGETITYTTSDNSYTNAGKYTVTATADDNSVNSNYDITITNGSMTIKPAETTTGDESKLITVADATAHYGDKTPDFTLTVGKDVVDPGNITNDDFTFINKATGEEVVGIPTDLGDYEVHLNENGQAKVTAANPNYVFSDDDFVGGTYTITPKVTDPNDVTTQIKVSAPSIIYGDTPEFTINAGSALTTAGVNLTADDYTITNAVYTNGGKYLAAGSYQVTLNAKGLAKLQAANPDYQLSADLVVGTTLVVNKKAIVITADPQNKVYGDQDPALTATIGAGVLGNDQVDYTVDRLAGEKVGQYVETVAGVNDNYQLITKDGTFTITLKATDPADATTKVTVNDQTIKEGEPTPTFTLNYGSQLVQVAVSNADFVFMQNGQLVAGTPTKAGTYTVMLSEAAQQRIAAEQNYALTISDFIAGTYVIQPTTTNPGDGGNTNPGNGGNTNPGNGGSTNPGNNSNTGNNAANSGADTVVTPNNTGDATTKQPTNTAVSSDNDQLVVATNTNADQTNNHLTIELPDKSKLPQTGEASGTATTATGLILLSGLLGLFGIRRKKHEDED